MDCDAGIGGRDGRFPGTRDSVVAALRSDDGEARRAAQDAVVAVYWKPLYKYLRVRWHQSNEDAQDLVQGFFAFVFERDTLSGFDPARAGFRTFLRLLIDRYVSNEAKARARRKRGGGAARVDFEAAEAELARTPPGASDPEEFIRREWVRAIFTAAVEQLAAEAEASGRQHQFRIFERFDLDDGERRPSYREVAAALGVSETKITNDLAAARRRFRAIVLRTLRSVTATDEEFAVEARSVLGIEP